MKKRLLRVAHWVSHLLSFVFVYGYVNPLYRPRTVKGSDRTPKAPFIMLGNHGTFLDPWLIGQRSLQPVYYMCNDDAWRAGPATRVYLDGVGAFPKKKGGVDYKALKATLRYLGQGSPVCIFPEGQTSWDGETQLIYKGLERLIKKAAVPVVIYNLCGNFLTKPWWAQTRRKGRVLVHARVLTPERIASLSDDELFAEIKQGVYHNDIKDERNRQVTFSGHDLAHGVERFMWSCMHCGAEDRLKTSGNDISCEACGGQWRMDAYCQLQPLREGFASLADLKDWSDLQRERVIGRINDAASDAELTHSDGVVLQTLADDGYTFLNRATGRLSVTKETLIFDPVSDESYALSIPVDELRDTVIQKKDICEVRHGETYYRFLFDGHSPMKWVYYLRYLRGFEKIEQRGYL
ncbi:MAG: hypothetical protein GF331_09745 [Chitinivibrionales bacterium]|nr:hypothetical protein [Chitinivibrionales bacterium]